MTKSKSLIFEKSITRDWSVLNNQIWHEVYTNEFGKQFKWQYTEGVFEGKDGNATVFRAPSEHIEGMRQFIIDNLEKDGKWMQKQGEIVEKQEKDIRKLVESFKEKDIDKYDNKELASFLEDIFHKNIELGPRFLIVSWFPMQMENHERWNELKSFIDRAIKARGNIEGIVPILDGFFRELAAEIMKRAKLDLSFAKYVTYEELKDFLKDDAPINKNKLSERKKYYIITNEGILHEDIGSYFKRIGHELHLQEIKDVSEFKGQTAYPGLAKGKAKIILNKSMFKEFKEGEILVTTMTTPDYLPLMKKSIAFITDEGGITCHAAIVARELKKPCIIGTKVATESLKNGDFIEVNADKGVVKILKTKK